MDQLSKVSHQYFQGKPAVQIGHLAVLLDQLGANEGLLVRIFEATIGQDGMEMPVQYMTTFTKYVISQVEKWAEKQLNQQGLDDDDETPGLDLWYEELEKLSRRPPEPFFRLYNFEPKQHTTQIKIFENENAFVSDGTTGLMTWTASTEFVKWMLTGEHLDQASWILELGAGTGLLGIAAIKSFPNLAKFVVTDGSERALENCQRNFATNLSPVESFKVAYETINWLSDIDKFQNLVTKYSLFGKGVLIGADIIFDVDLVQPLIDLINVFFDTHDPGDGRSCLLCCTIRNEKTIGVFRAKLDNLTNRSIIILHSWDDEENGKGIILEITSISK